MKRNKVTTNKKARDIVLGIQKRLLVGDVKKRYNHFTKQWESVT